MRNKRLEFQKLLSSENRELSKVYDLILEDTAYAEVHFQNLLTRALRVLSPVVGRKQDREFDVQVRVKVYDGVPVLAIGVAFKPLHSDNYKETVEILLNEVEYLTKMKNFNEIVGAIAVNGELKVK